MEAIVDIGLNQFIRLRKLRIEHLEGDRMTSSDLHCQVYRRFLEQLGDNQTITFVKLERVFNNNAPMRQALITAIKHSRVRKCVLWADQSPGADST